MAGEVQFVANPEGIAYVLHSPQGAVAAELLRRLVRIHARAVALCPVDRGRLRSSLRFWVDVVDGQLVGIVGTDVEYALMVHEGTGMHGPRGDYIYPRNAAVLRWQANDGRVVFARRTRGMRGRPFLAEALAVA